MFSNIFSSLSFFFLTQAKNIIKWTTIGLQKLYPCIIAFSLAYNPYEAHGKTGINLSNKQIEKHIKVILNTLNIPYDSDNSITEQAIKLWKRQPGQERWQQSNIPLTRKQTTRINKSLKALGLISAISPPSRTHFSEVLIFGARTGGMKIRLEYAYQLMKQKNLIYDSMVILAGERTLTTIDGQNELDAIDLKPSDYKLLNKYPKTEADAANLLIKVFPPPQKIKNGVRVLSTDNINTPTVMRRANTRDTLETWVKKYIQAHPGTPQKKSNILLISSQPFIPYQRSITTSVLKNNHITHINYIVAGPESPKRLRMIDKLNALASWLDNISP